MFKSHKLKQWNRTNGALAQCIAKFYLIKTNARIHVRLAAGDFPLLIVC